MKKKNAFKRAIGYARVSSTKQKTEGNSLETQVSNIENFCYSKGISLIKMFEEDYSGKDFNRPQYKKLLDYLKLHKNSIDYLLLDRLDRFSRNIEEALKMQRKLSDMNIEVNYVSEWIDTSSADSKLLTNLKLSIAEIERDKIIARTSGGYRQAIKEGRYSKTPPVGYIRKKDSRGKTNIFPNEKADLIKSLFHDYSLSIYSQKDLIQKYNVKGLKLSKSSISRILENPLYAGYLDYKHFDIEPYELVKGKFEEIIPKELFDKVQLLKNKKNNHQKTVRRVNEYFPLTSFLLCAKCGQPFYGSNSNNGKNKKVTSYYFYYECKSNCKCNERYHASTIHSKFKDLLSNIKPSEKSIELFKKILIEEYTKNSTERIHEINQINADLNSIQKKILSVTEKYIEEDITQEEHSLFKQKYEHQKIELENRKSNLGNFQNDIDKLLTFGISMITNMDKFFEKAPVKIQRKILGSNFSDKLTFSNGEFRTVPFNEAILLMSRFGKGLEPLKRKSGTTKKLVSHSVPRAETPPT